LADEETGLHYNYFRDYDPSTGRYVESDPLGLYDGPNTFLYAYANPISLYDPTGEAVPVVAGAIWGYRAYSAYRAARVARLAAVASRALVQQMGDGCENQCPQCRTVSGKIVPVGTIGFRPLDTIPDTVKQHGVYGSHHNLFKANQIPYPNCDCFWQKLGNVAKPHQIQPNWIPIEPFIN
jgi:RHS repeat-associated protein